MTVATPDEKVMLILGSFMLPSEFSITVPVAFLTTTLLIATDASPAYPSTKTVPGSAAVLNALILT